MMNIWIINQYCMPEDERSRQRIIARFLKKENYEVFVLCGLKSPNCSEDSGYKQINNSVFIKDIEGIKYVMLDAYNYRLRGQVGRVLSSILFQIRIKNLVNIIGAPDLIINEFAGIFGWISTIYKRKYGTKIVYDILDFWPQAFVELGYMKNNNLILKLMYYFEKKTYESADYIFFSVAGGKEYIRDKKWDIENGGRIDLNRVKYLNNSLEVGRTLEELTVNNYIDTDLDTEKFKVVYVGAINKPNNVDSLLKIAYEARNIDDLLFLVYGDGSDLNRLKGEALRLGLTNIKFKGFIPYEYAANVVSRADLAYWCFNNLPLLKYGISNNKFFLYAAAGKPIVSTVDTEYDLIHEYNCGKVVPDDAKLGLEAVLYFKNLNRESYDAYCKNAFRAACDYDYTVTINGLLKTIRELIGRE